MKFKSDANYSNFAFNNPSKANINVFRNTRKKKTLWVDLWSINYLRYLRNIIIFPLNPGIHISNT